MKYLMIKCNKSDKSFIDDIEKSFPNIERIEEEGFTSEEWITFSIPIASLTVQIVDFVLNHLTNNKNAEQATDNEKRVIITPDGEISLIGYSRKDVVRILEELKR